LIKTYSFKDDVFKTALENSSESLGFSFSSSSEYLKLKIFGLATKMKSAEAGKMFSFLRKNSRSNLLALFLFTALPTFLLATTAKRLIPRLFGRKIINKTSSSQIFFPSLNNLSISFLLSFRRLLDASVLFSCGSLRSFCQSGSSSLLGNHAFF